MGMWMCMHVCTCIHTCIPFQILVITCLTLWSHSSYLCTYGKKAHMQETPWSKQIYAQHTNKHTSPMAAESMALRLITDSDLEKVLSILDPVALGSVFGMAAGYATAYERSAAWGPSGYVRGRQLCMCGCMYACVCVCVCMYAYMYVCIHACMHASMRLSIFMCMCAGAYMLVCTAI